jgi:hypothetical protein
MRLFAHLVSGLVAVSSTFGLAGVAAARPHYVPVVAPAPRHQVGARVEVLWGHRYYDARVLAVRGDDYLVRYEGYSAFWDEWVDDARVRGVAAGIVRQPSWVFWRGAWREARFLERRGDWIRVSSNGWRDGEWVEADAYRVGVRPGRHERPARYDRFGQDRWSAAYRPVRSERDWDRPEPMRPRGDDDRWGDGRNDGWDDGRNDGWDDGRNDGEVAVRPNAPRPEPQRPEPQRPEPQRPEPQRPEPQRPEPQRPEPQRPEPQRPEPQRPNPGQPTRPDAGPTEPARPQPQQPPASGERPAGGHARPAAGGTATPTSPASPGTPATPGAGAGQARPTPSGQPARPNP